MGVTGRCECPQRGFRGGVPHKVPWVALSAHSVPAGQAQLVPPTLAPAALLDLLGDSPGALPHSPAEPLTATPVPLSVPHPCWAEPLPGSTSNPLAPTSLLLPQPPWRGLCTPTRMAHPTPGSCFLTSSLQWPPRGTCPHGLHVQGSCPAHQPHPLPACTPTARPDTVDSLLGPPFIGAAQGEGARWEALEGDDGRSSGRGQCSRRKRKWPELPCHGRTHQEEGRPRTPPCLHTALPGVRSV